MASRKVDERIGLQFGRLTILHKADNDKHNKTRWNCLCNCGVTCIRGWAELRTGDCHSCGCLAKEISASRQKYKLVGERFGQLIVVEKLVNIYGNEARWRCACDCGASKVLSTKDLVQGRYKTCGHGSKICKVPQEEAWVRKRFSAYKSNAKKDNRKFELSITDFSNIVNRPCNYCGGLDHYQTSRSDYKNKRPDLLPIFHKVGIDRVDSSIGYVLDNLVPCCKMCNKMKMEFSLEVWKNQVRKIYEQMELGKSNS